MSTRYTCRSLQNLVEKANEVLPNIEGKHFAIDACYGGYKVCLCHDDCGAMADLYCKRGNPRYAATEFMNWLFDSSCPREPLFDLWDYAYEQGIRL